MAASIVNRGWAGNLYFGALHWRKSVEQVYMLQQRIPDERWLEVRYESLLADAPRILRQVCAFLGVAYSDQMLRYSEDSTYDAPDPDNADRWRRRLSPRKTYLAEMAAGDLLEPAGYQRLFPPAEPGRLERLAIRLHHRIAGAQFRCSRYGAYLLLVRKLGRAVGIRRTRWDERLEAIRNAHIK